MRRLHEANEGASEPDACESKGKSRIERKKEEFRKKRRKKRHIEHCQAHALNIRMRVAAFTKPAVIVTTHFFEPRCTLREKKAYKVVHY